VDDWRTELLALAYLTVPAVALYVGWRRNRLGLAFTAVAVALLGIGGATLVAVNADYRDADGHMDCWPSCTTFQETIGLTFWYSIPLLAVLALASAGVALVSRWRRKAARPLG
jgi:hypothetical protein